MNSIDRGINESSLPEPDIVKIDVEGVELDVLHGMAETIARRKPRLFVRFMLPTRKPNAPTRNA